MTRHIVYWVLIIFSLISFFAYESNLTYAVYFVSFLMPIAIGTTYFFNYYLVPKFLLTGKRLLFALYFVYTLIISFYLEIIVMIMALAVLANFNYNQMSPGSGSLFTLSIIIYLIVFITAFFKLIQQVQLHKESVSALESDNAKLKKAYIKIRIDRKDFNLSLKDTLYIESLADYVKIHTTEKALVTKEKISSLEDRFPSNFVRVHRSYIVNKDWVSTFSKEEIAIKNTDIHIPISRTFKNSAISALSNSI